MKVFLSPVSDVSIHSKMHTLFCMPEVYEYLADGESPPPQVALEWIESGLRDLASARGGLWMLRPESSADELVGLVRLEDCGSAQAELTYLLHPSIWGSGFATRIAHTAMLECFKEGKTDSIWAGADEPNKGSIAVMQRLGMTFKRRVVYPSGPGVEYEISVAQFSPERLKPIAVLR